mmetsp:Transcript_21167/g.58089  ORF Transcript_21167/g.58089 Transcript_21167/m.58089 type:complete len:573 (-) Transcript_21167:126-1844(-)
MSSSAAESTATLAAVRADLAAAKSEAADWRNAAAEAREKSETHAGERDALKEELTSRNNALRSLGSQLVGVRDELSAEKEALLQAKHELLSTRSELNEVKREREELRSSSVTELSRAKKELLSAKQEMERLRKELAAARSAAALACRSNSGLVYAADANAIASSGLPQLCNGAPRDSDVAPPLGSGAFHTQHIARTSATGHTCAQMVAAPAAGNISAPSMGAATPVSTCVSLAASSTAGAPCSQTKLMQQQSSMQHNNAQSVHSSPMQPLTASSRSTIATYPGDSHTTAQSTGLGEAAFSPFPVPRPVVETSHAATIDAFSLLGSASGGTLDRTGILDQGSPPRGPDFSSSFAAGFGDDFGSSFAGPPSTGVATPCSAPVVTALQQGQTLASSTDPDFFASLDAFTPQPLAAAPLTAPAVALPTSPPPASTPARATPTDLSESSDGMPSMDRLMTDMSWGSPHHTKSAVQGFCDEEPESASLLSDLHPRATRTTLSGAGSGDRRFLQNGFAPGNGNVGGTSTGRFGAMLGARMREAKEAARMIGEGVKDGVREDIGTAIGVVRAFKESRRKS